MMLRCAVSKMALHLLALGAFACGRQAMAGDLAMNGAPHPGVEALRPGEQFVHLPNGRDPATVVLAGRTVDIGSASALIGSSSDAIYVAVAAGQAKVDAETAGPGQAILLAPMGAAPKVVTFDAERAAALFGSRPPESLQGFLADLQRVADEQSIGLFFGIYQRTVFDLHAPGGVRAEAGRASVMGAPEVVRIRYSGQNDPDVIEEIVVRRAAQALVRRDVEALAQLLDPSPFGGDDLSGGGGDARRLVARELIDSRAVAAAGGVRRGAGAGVWRAGGVTIRTRPFSDFIFVSSVE